MDTFILLSSSALISLAIHFSLRHVSALNTKGHENAVNSRKGSDLEKSVNKYDASSRVFLPDVLTRWPWPRQISPYYLEIEKEGATCLASTNAFNPKAQAVFNRCKFSLCASLLYPNATKERVRSGRDLMHVFFVFDEYSDRSSPSEVHSQKDIILDVLRNPHKPRSTGEWIGGEITRQFWAPTVKDATDISRKRFIQHMDDYLTGVIQESVDKKDHRILDIKSYIELRRHTSAARAVFSMVELELDIPDEVMLHPALQEIIVAAIDIVALSNDILSYNMEQVRGDHLHNIVTSVMYERNTDVNGAMLWVEDYIFQLSEKFVAGMESLPKWKEPVSSQVKQYCNGMGEVLRGNYEWSYEGERYFGNKGPEIRKNKWLSILPKSDDAQIGPLQIDSSLL